MGASEDRSKYLVFQAHVTWAERSNLPDLLKILKEAERNLSLENNQA
jgi:hypothetical protein